MHCIEVLCGTLGAQLGYNHNLDTTTTWIQPQLGHNHNLDTTTTWTQPQLGYNHNLDTTTPLFSTFSILLKALLNNRPCIRPALTNK